VGIAESNRQICDSATEAWVRQMGYCSRIRKIFAIDSATLLAMIEPDEAKPAYILNPAKAGVYASDKILVSLIRPQ
jgi:hypothetical protein